MAELNEATPPARRNPLIWIALVVVGLILFIFLSGERGDVPVILKTSQTPFAVSEDDAVADVEVAETAETAEVTGTTEVTGTAEVTG
ncbi:hypothetical protein N8198_04525, partial [Gammaproteobacteria bacterium]|nr:hypothetical protein [Gammaproteobacteria bacterium]